MNKFRSVMDAEGIMVKDLVQHSGIGAKTISKLRNKSRNVHNVRDVLVSRALTSFNELVKSGTVYTREELEL